MMRIELENEMTIYTVAEQRDKLLPLPSDCNQLIVDASALQEVDGAGTQLLLLVARECHEQGIDCRLINAPSALKDIVDLLRLSDIDWFSSESEEAA